LSLTPAPPQALLTFSDKLLHSAGYLALYLSCSFAYPQPATVNRKLFFLFFYSILIELIQHFIPQRSFSFLDILANGFGLLSGVALFTIFQFIQSKRKK
jgi:VanZ family protein